VNALRDHHVRITQPLRIAVVTETFPPEVNGVAGTVATMVRGLLRRGHRIDVIRPRQVSDYSGRHSPLCAEVLVPGLPIPGYPHLRFGMPAERRLVERWRVLRPDVVQVVTEGPLGWSALRAARKLGVPCASEFHTNFHAYSDHYGAGLLHRPIACYLRNFHNRAAITMVPTRQLVASLSTAGYRRLTVVSRGVDTALFSPTRRSHQLRASWGVAANQPVVIHVGRLAAEKNLDLLFRAFELMRRIRPDARLVIVGDGPERVRLEREFPGHSFVGIRRGEHLAEHYASADIFLYPSLTETFGNVVTEAMASGLAVHAFNYAAAGEHIRHDANGVVTGFGDEQAFIEQACALVQDPVRIARLRAAARVAAEKIDWERVLDTLEDTLFMTATGILNPRNFAGVASGASA
jgi:glycosyltransferase involved in cell wall biosynthesis